MIDIGKHVDSFADENENSCTNQAVIRFENAGCILWSPVFERYYLLCEDLKDSFMVAMINKHKSVSEISREMPELGKQFAKLGIDDSARILMNFEKSNRKLFAPLECYFDFTTRCNLRCSGCYNSKHLGNTTMEIEDIVKIIHDLWRAGVQRIFVAGGEPTMEMEALKAYIDTAVSLGMTTSVATNGTLLTEDVCRYLLSRPLIDISISIDGWNEASNSERRNKGVFEKTCEGVRTLVHIKKELGSRTEICVKPIVDRYQDIDFFENMIGLTLKLGADKVKFANPERSLNHPLGYYGRDVKKYYDNIKLIQRLQKKFKDQIAVTNGTNPCIGFGIVGIAGMTGCIGGQELIAINGDGRITPCLMNHVVLGNYYDYGSMWEFFETSKALDDFVAQIQYEECYTCNLYPRCRGGCQVRKIVEYGAMTGRDPICPITNGIPLDGVTPVSKEILSHIRVVHSL